MATSPPRPGAAVRDWAPDVAAGLCVLAIGLAEIAVVHRPLRTFAPGESPRTSDVLVVLAFALACGLSRRAPSVALALVWGTGVVQVLTGSPLLTVQLTALVVAFGCARWGSPATVAVSGLSIPLACVLLMIAIREGSFEFFEGVILLPELIDSASRLSDRLLLGAAILGAFMLTVPWLAGLLLRAVDRARRSEMDRALADERAEQAREIAALQERQTRLAHDVHDVVGHSLAVILAQAESAQFLEDPEELKRTLATIASSARTSLRDVRGVLSGEADPTHDLVDLLDGVRAAGRDVVVEEHGQPRPLPPDLRVVAHRVIQEMLTNAVKHGDPGGTISVERHWPTGSGAQHLVIRAANPPGAGGGDESGRGIDGMRRRLESVGGHLEVTTGPDGRFVVTAWVPVRAGAGE